MHVKMVCPRLLMASLVESLGLKISIVPTMLLLAPVLFVVMLLHLLGVRMRMMPRAAPSGARGAGVRRCSFSVSPKNSTKR